MNLKLRVLGIVLVLAGIIGFLTVADDLRHKGELLGAGSILLSGLVLLVVSFLFKHRTVDRDYGKYNQ